MSFRTINALVLIVICRCFTVQWPADLTLLSSGVGHIEPFGPAGWNSNSADTKWMNVCEYNDTVVCLIVSIRLLGCSNEGTDLAADFEKTGLFGQPDSISQSW